ncbi:MAG: hypothetical protein NVSMB6_04560 [Burkholderiaceae bacterium]
MTRIILAMSHHPNSDPATLRAEIAIAAARLIAEEGADYGSAKRRAARLLLGDGKVRGDVLPNNAQIEEEVRAHQALFFGDTQPQRLQHLREIALAVMEMLTPYSPYLTGAVLNGTAGKHSDVHLQLFADSAKEVAVFLMDRNIQFEVSESTHFKGRPKPVETLSFLWEQEGVHLAVYEVNDLRGALRSSSAGKVERMGVNGVRALLGQSSLSISAEEPRAGTL